MNEPADNDPLIARASAALRSRTYANDSARTALVHTLTSTGRAGPAALTFRHRIRIAIGIAAGIAAAIVLVIGAHRTISERDRGTTAVVTPANSQTTMVEFSFDAPAARLVSVVGEFNKWDTRAAPMRHAANGHWTTNLALAPGRHTYDFSIDGNRLVPDPRAPVAPERMFGVRHSVLVVTEGER